MSQVWGESKGVQRCRTRECTCMMPTGISLAMVLAVIGCANVSPTAKSENLRPAASADEHKTPSRFLANLPREVRLPNLDDPVNRRLLANYGAVFVAQGVTPPPVLVFSDEAEVERWQAGLKTERARIHGFEVELQAPALEALLASCAEGKKSHVEITPRTRDAARRDYARTVLLWQRRIDAGLQHWLAKGKITRAEAKRIKALSPHDQIVEIERLEKQGLFFSQLFNKPILDSAAPPGASQHLSLLAIDIKEHTEPKTRAILARHDWFQTVPCDLSHFTYLGVSEARLPSLGLKQVTCGKRQFWAPDLGIEVPQRESASPNL